jgi:hypothetical protein
MDLGAVWSDIQLHLMVVGEKRVERIHHENQLRR